MTEMLERGDLASAQQEAERAAAVHEAEPAPEKKSVKEKWRGIPKKRRRKMVRWTVVLLVVILAAALLYRFLGGKGGNDAQVVTDFVSYGAITSTVEGSGLTKAKNSETITLTTGGTVQDVMVTEGQQVTAGTPLFAIDSEAARTAVEKARQDVETEPLRRVCRKADGDGEAEPRRHHQ